MKNLLASIVTLITTNSDNIPPTVSITLSKYSFKINDTATVTFTFSEVPVGFTSANVTAQNGNISSFSPTGNPLVYTATFTPDADIVDATNVITVDTNWTDGAGNAPSSNTNSNNYTIDTTGQFEDTFDRADTTDGNIGLASYDGTPWDLRGPYVSGYPLPVSNYGKIVSNRYTADANQIVYATRILGNKVLHLSASVSWVAGGGATGLAGAAFIITHSSNLLDTMLHIPVARAASNIQKRINNGAFITMKQANGTDNATIAAPTLLKDVVHTIDILVSGNTCTLTIDGTRSVTAVDNDIPSLIGKYVVYEVYHPTASMVDLVRFESVSAEYE